MRVPGFAEGLGRPFQINSSGGGNPLSQPGNAVGRGVEALTGGIGRVLEAGGNLLNRGVQAVTGGLNQLGQEVARGNVDRLNLGRGVVDGGVQAVTRGFDQMVRAGGDVFEGFQSNLDRQRERLFGSYSPTDGQLVGNGGQSYEAGTPLSQVAPTPSTPQTQADGSAPPTVIYVNGIQTDRANHEAGVQALADAGHNVIGIHNETYGPGGVWDVLEAAQNKFGGGNTPAQATLTDAIVTEVNAGRDLHLVGHSQGGEITAQSLFDARQQLIDQGRTPEEVEALFREHVDVETYGSAALNYPDGPEYVHYVHEEDAITNTVGTGSPFGFHLGEDAVVRNIEGDAYGLNFDDHHLNVYLQHHVPFEEAREAAPSNR